jgi:hypothetical protein
MTPIVVDKQYNSTQTCNAQQLTDANGVMGVPCMSSRAKINHRLRSVANHDVNDDNENIAIIPLDVTACCNGIFTCFKLADVNHDKIRH